MTTPQLTIKMDGLKKAIDKIDGVGVGYAKAKSDLNMARARAFVIYLSARIEGGQLGLTKISDATIRLSGSDHNPLSDTGELVQAMEARPVGRGGGAAAGWFGDGPVNHKGIPYAKIVALQEAGYVIAVTAKMRRTLWFRGVMVSGDTMRVPPRPFMVKAARAYHKSGQDLAIARQFIERIIDGSYKNK